MLSKEIKVMKSVPLRSLRVSQIRSKGNPPPQEWTSVLGEFKQQKKNDMG